ncbi:ZCN10 protein [Zea mays]|uniref:MFT2-Corn MFT-like protein n=1 Tax=Zea mays TaxID=4577 RepID=A8WES2_MAIZE|nr:ZCN10 protein [Zea mays]ABW96233.1 ZCN10 [Zea mays]ABX11012.1 ZCN10 [Zea mays]ACG24375.1 MFT2 - Corn MFT-like protein [Zea mays]ONM30557.1 Protein MOTHER of FT and TFL1 [Zea mays]ONM30558.1 Protein MOTHER of FT and TFL1 [Zea mays]|eukprot:NP_001106249.1 ZCN10 protein [Zea mays]
MARFVDPLVVGRVIGEVVDLFVPSVSMTVAYGPKDISNGCLLKPSATAAPPLVRISGRRDDLYTLIMTDPDAPSPSDPTMREYLHWIVTNIPGGTDANKGEEVVEYMGPRPPVGIHRYVLVLFEQKTRVHAEGPGERANFNTRAFAAAHELGLPTAVVYFNAQKEPANHRRR